MKASTRSSRARAATAAALASTLPMAALSGSVLADDTSRPAPPAAR